MGICSLAGVLAPGRPPLSDILFMGSPDVLMPHVSLQTQAKHHARAADRQTEKPVCPVDVPKHPDLAPSIAPQLPWQLLFGRCAGLPRGTQPGVRWGAEGPRLGPSSAT